MSLYIHNRDLTYSNDISGQLFLLLGPLTGRGGEGKGGEGRGGEGRGGEGRGGEGRGGEGRGGEGGGAMSPCRI